MSRLSTIIALLCIAIASACAKKSLPFEGGVVFSQKEIKKTFQPILTFMHYRPGMAFADVGAGSGAFAIMMATLMDSSKVYIQDIDTVVLKEKNVKKMVEFYSKQGKRDLEASNDFDVVVGTVFNTHLPDSTFDLIYSNATAHCFASLDSIAKDLRGKLKPGGVLYVRDSFAQDHGEGRVCSDPKCARPLLSIDECLAIMTRNGYRLVNQSPDMSGYPIFGFSVVE
jgi:ubiquinone/menaquinone biosynthesis C-methylase UbiE